MVLNFETVSVPDANTKHKPSFCTPSSVHRLKENAAKITELRSLTSAKHQQCGFDGLICYLFIIKFKFICTTWWAESFTCIAKLGYTRQLRLRLCELLAFQSFQHSFLNIAHPLVLHPSTSVEFLYVFGFRMERWCSEQALSVSLRSILFRFVAPYCCCVFLVVLIFFKESLRPSWLFSSSSMSLSWSSSADARIRACLAFKRSRTDSEPFFLLWVQW